MTRRERQQSEETHDGQPGDQQAFRLQTRTGARRDARGGARPARRSRGHGRLSRVAGEGSGAGRTPFGYEGARSRHDDRLLQGGLSRRAGKPRPAHLGRAPRRAVQQTTAGLRRCSPEVPRRASWTYQAERHPLRLGMAATGRTTCHKFFTFVHEAWRFDRIVLKPL